MTDREAKISGNVGGQLIYSESDRSLETMLKSVQNDVSDAVYIIIVDLTTMLQRDGMTPTFIRPTTDGTAFIAWDHTISCTVSDSGFVVKCHLSEKSVSFENDLPGREAGCRQILQFVELFHQYAQDYFGDKVDVYEEIY